MTNHGRANRPFPFPRNCRDRCVWAFEGADGCGLPLAGGGEERMLERVKIQPEEIVRALRDMRPRTKLYEAVRAELKRQGRWKNRARGRHVSKVKPRT